MKRDYYKRASQPRQDYQYKADLWELSEDYGFIFVE